jgi:5'-3' exoribonuclease 1
LDRTENDKFRAIVDTRKSSNYYPSFNAAEMVGISGRALSKITSSFMVIMSDNSKINLGLSLKFEAKALKVIDYSRKEGRYWEFSEKAIELIQEYKVGCFLILVVVARLDGVVVGQVSTNLWPA